MSGKRFLAVDVGTGRIKMIDAGFRRRRLKVHSFGCWPAPQPRSGDYWEGGELAGILARAAGELGANSSCVVATLGAESVFLKVFKAKLVPGKELAGLILRKAAGLLPFPLEEAVLRYRVLGPAGGRTGSEREILVLIAAASAGAVRRYYETFLEAGLLLKALDLQHFSLWRAVFGSRRLKNGVAVHIGCRTTLFLVVEEGRIIFARTIPAGGDLVASAVAGAGGVSREEAWSLIGQLGDKNLPAESAAAPAQDAVQVEFSLKEGLSALLGEISRAVEAYSSVLGAFSPEKVILSGGGSALSGVEEWLKTAWEVPVEVFYPAFPAGEGGQSEITLDPTFTVVLGTALRGVI